MRSNNGKTRIVIKADPLLSRWVILDDGVIALINARVKIHREALDRICDDCGTMGCMVMGDRIMPVCQSCGTKRLNRYLFGDDDDET